MESPMHFFFLILGTLGLASCSSNSAFHSERRDSQNRVIALFSEPERAARCVSVVEAEPGQFVSVDLANALKNERIRNLDDCASISRKSKSTFGSYVSRVTQQASGLSPMDNFEFKPNRWPVEFHADDRVYHIFQGKVLSVRASK